MAVNEKAIYAERHTSFGGRGFKPGERMDDKGLPSYVLESALRNNVATDSSKRADAARDFERARQIDVQRQIDGRSEKRDFVQREDRR